MQILFLSDSNHNYSAKTVKKFQILPVQIKTTKSGNQADHPHLRECKLICTWNNNTNEFSLFSCFSFYCTASAFCLLYVQIKSSSVSLRSLTLNSLKSMNVISSQPLHASNFNMRKAHGEIVTIFFFFL